METMNMFTPEEQARYARVRANRARILADSAPATQTAQLRAACAGSDICPKCGGVRQTSQRAAAGPNDAPPPPDVATRIQQKGNHAGAKHAAAEATRISGVRTLLRAFIPSPVRDEPTLGLPEPLVAAANAAQHAAPAPPSLIDRIRQKKQGGVK